MIGATGETGMPDLPTTEAASSSTVTILVLEIFFSYKTNTKNILLMSYLNHFQNFLSDKLAYS